MKKVVRSAKKLEILKMNIAVLNGDQAMRIYSGATTTDQNTNTNTTTQNTSLNANDCSGLRTNTGTGGSSVGVG